MREDGTTYEAITDDTPLTDVLPQLYSAMDVAVMAPVSMTVQFVTHNVSGDGVLTETHRIESMQDALCVMLLAMQAYGFTVETLAALDTDENGEVVDSDAAERFLDGQTYIN